LNFDAFLTAVHPEDRDFVRLAVDAVLTEKMEYRVEHRVLRQDGSVYRLASRGRAHFDEAGNPIKLIGVSLDITEQLAARDEAKRHEARFQALFQRAAVGIAILDENGRALESNRILQELLGYTAEEMRQMTFAQITHPDDVGTDLALFWEIVGGVRESYELEKRYIRKDGETIWARLTASRLTDPEGQATLAVAIVEDVTRRRLAESDAERLRQEISHFARVTMMGELTAAIAHELNQPLSAILSNSQAALRFLSQENPDLSMVKEILDDIVSDDRRASEVIVRLRALLSKGRTAHVPLDINDIIQEVAGIIRVDTRMKDCRFRLTLAPGLPKVLGDRVQVQQVLLNLIINALDAMKTTQTQDRQINVTSALHSAREIIVSVRDRGSGIPEEKLQEIFEPFYTGKAEGMGMGLSICRSIVQSHGGRIMAKNNLARGATVEFTLPIMDGSEVE
jgi:two-component system sensor kinase FixL